MRNLRRHLLINGLLLFSAGVLAATHTKKKAKKQKLAKTVALGKPLQLDLPIVQAWIAKTKSTHLPENFILDFLKQARTQDIVKKHMDPPAVGVRKNWAVYKARFTDPLRTKKGYDFLAQYGSTFRKATAVYGIPAPVIAAIIGIETLYGTFKGNFKLIDVLTTLAFEYPRRSAYFQEELAVFMHLVFDGKLDKDTRGSFAGAIGFPQFMPSSLQRFGVSDQGVQLIDLVNSPEDAIMSVAAFLFHHGWVKDLTVAFETTLIDDTIAPRLLRLDATPVYEHDTVAIYSTLALPKDVKYAVVDLQHVDEATEYLLTTQNFHTIMQYNRSYFYAAAVWYFAKKLGLEAIA